MRINILSSLFLISWITKPTIGLLNNNDSEPWIPNISHGKPKNYLYISSLESKMNINCWKDSAILYDGLEEKRNISRNLINLAINNCPADLLVKVLNATGMGQNGKSKLLQLNNMRNLTAEHLTGIDKLGVDILVVKTHEVTSMHSDLFSTIPTLPNLVLNLKDTIEPIPSLSKLSELQTFDLTISFNTEGREHRMSF